MHIYFPKYFTSRAIVAYIIVLFIVTMLFLDNMLPIPWMIFGIIEVLLFFAGSEYFTKAWSVCDNSIFEKQLFVCSLLLRIAWVLFSYFFYQFMTDSPFEFDAADAIGYHGEGIWVHEMLFGGDLNPYWEYIGGRYSDMGYPFYLGIQYFITDNSILIARLLKALYGAIISVFIYKIASRNFGESTGRIAGILAMLNPNLIYYCGLHVKEMEMLLLTVWFIERADNLLRSKNYSFLNIFVVLLLAGSLFFFRTVLGATAFFSLGTAVVFSSSKIGGWKKRVVIGFWVLSCLVYFAGGKISQEVSMYWQLRDVNQSTNMEWRAEREGGNSLAKYGNAAVFAPMIFAAPFPTMVNVEGQENQMMLNGANFTRNIYAFFTMFALFLIIIRKKYREHLLILSFLIGYLCILCVSSFVLSERFHIPVVPCLLMFAAYGISQINNKSKGYYVYYLVFIGLVIIAWNWFKLAGRGLD